MNKVLRAVILCALWQVCFILLLLVGCAPSQQVDPYELLEKHYRAIGLGDSTTTRLETTYVEGISVVHNLDMEGRFKRWSGPSSRIRQEGISSEFVFIHGNNGEYAWRKEASGLLVVERDSIAQIRHQEEVLWQMYEQLNRESEFFSLSYQGSKTVNNLPCHVLEITCNLTSSLMYMYIDTLDYYEIARIEITDDGEFQEYFSDFREVEGFIYAFRDSTVHVGGPSPLTMITTKLIINPSLHDSIFEPSPDTLTDMTFE